MKDIEGTAYTLIAYLMPWAAGAILDGLTGLYWDVMPHDELIKHIRYKYGGGVETYGTRGIDYYK